MCVKWVYLLKFSAKKQKKIHIANFLRPFSFSRRAAGLAGKSGSAFRQKMQDFPGKDAALFGKSGSAFGERMRRFSAAGMGEGL